MRPQLGLSLLSFGPQCTQLDLAHDAAMPPARRILCSIFIFCFCASSSINRSQYLILATDGQSISHSLVNSKPRRLPKMIGRVRNQYFGMLVVLFTVKFAVCGAALDLAIDIRDSWAQGKDGRPVHASGYGELRVCQATDLSGGAEAGPFLGGAPACRVRGRTLLLLSVSA